MTKIFAVYAKVKLTKKPDWLDDFRKKYDEKYDFHITLKQPCVIEENQIADVKNKLSQALAKFNLPNHRIEVTFDEITIDEQAIDGAYIMINAKKNETLVNLQKNIKKALKSYDNFSEPKDKEYEENFVPHLTIARRLDDETLKRAKKDLLDDYSCGGIIEKIYLSVVKEDNAQEAKNPNNISIYKL